jgi:hypothetical protein
VVGTYAVVTAPTIIHKGQMMNNELKKLAQQAGAPKEALDELWFNIFCMKFADVILINAEQEMFEIKNRVSKLEE